jgi:signal transduction histidine kinase
VNAGKGIGLNSMHNRAKMISAELSIESEKFNGTVTQLRLLLHIEDNLQG